MKVLVTGGGGFLGRYVLKLLLARGDHCVSFQRTFHQDLQKHGVEVVTGSLTSREDVDRAMAGCDAVIHIAAKAGVWGSRKLYWDVNVTGTKNVLESAKQSGVSAFVHTSTPSVVFNGGSFQGEDESLPYGCNWLCHYAESKAEAEALALSMDGDGFRVCALRPHLIWGIGDPHLVPKVLAMARSGKMQIVGDGGNRVDVTRVENAAKAHVQALDALQAGRCGGKAYFLSQGEPVYLWEWINSLLTRLDLPRVEKCVSLKSAYRAGWVLEKLWSGLRLRGEPPMTRFVAVELAKDHWFSIERSRRDFGYNPEAFPTDAGLAGLVVHLGKRHNSSASVGKQKGIS